MEILGHNASYEAAKDSSNASGHPGEGNQVLWAVLWVFSSLYAHDGISDDVDKGLRKGSTG